MHIHFVCTGNIYRSRIAEAYLKSKNISKVKASSSGTNAEYYSGKIISSFATNVLREEGLLEYASRKMKQTTREVLNDADLIIFMTKEHYDWAVDSLGYKGDNYEIWDIKDIGSEEIVKSIKANVDSLVNREIYV
ncbi:MAG: low molecular weight phosphatase family protein [Candidatus Spechtbacterales bacterium]|nr:low molecular weight phosphatase family protein [Candidatus Spechtbacterales bacterium]